MYTLRAMPVRLRQEAWKIARSLVVGYIEEDDDEEYRHEKDQEDKRRETEDRQEGKRKQREEDKHKKNGDRKRRDEDPKEGENKRREEEKEKEHHQEGFEGEAPPVPGKKEGYFNFGRNGLPSAGSKMPIAKDSLVSLFRCYPGRSTPSMAGHHHIVSAGVSQVLNHIGQPALPLLIGTRLR